MLQWQAMTDSASDRGSNPGAHDVERTATRSPREGSRPAGDLALWRTVAWLQGLPEPVVAELAAAAVPARYHAGTTIFWEGDPVNGLYLVAQGTVKICRYSKDGREHILHFMQAGDTFNDVAALDGGPNPATAIAHSDVVVWRLPRPALHAVVDRHPDLAWALIESLARRARFLVGQVQDLAMRNVRGRLAKLLLEQAGDNDSVPRFLTQEEMAARLGTVREVVGRSLRSLAADGILEFDRHRIVILDPERLAEEAEL